MRFTMSSSQPIGGTSERITAWAEGIILLEGWHRHGVAFAAGLVAALALAPLDLLPAFLLAFPVLVWLIDGSATGAGWRRLANARRAAAVGWSFGFGYFLAGLWWLGVAFVTGGEEFLWLMPLGVIGLPMVLACFTAFGAGVAGLLWSGGTARIVALAFGLGLAEWLRGIVLTGFPWNSYGQAVANHLLLAQSASLIGAEGLTLLAILLGASPAVLGTGRHGRERWLAPVLGSVLLLAMLTFGFARLQVSGGLAFDAALMPVQPNVRLRLVQPNVSEAERRNPNAGATLFQRNLDLSMRPAGKPGDEARAITHLFWPEAPLPFVLDREPRALGALTRMLGNNQTLITGAIRSEEIGSGEIGGGTGNARLRYFNAIQHYDGKGLQSSYDKRHLVPFGEYLPFEAALRALGLRQFVGVIGGFTAATRAGQLQVPDLPPIVPMICFESIFPHEIETSGHGQQVIVNVTNDSWFGQTSGPYQHLAQARLRAIEFGHPLIRAANGGISTVFDPFGRVVDKLPLQAAGILDVPLPTGLESTLYRRTIQVSYGPVMMLLLLIALIGILRGAKRALRSRVGEGSTF